MPRPTNNSIELYISSACWVSKNSTTTKTAIFLKPLKYFTTNFSLIVCNTYLHYSYKFIKICLWQEFNSKVWFLQLPARNVTHLLKSLQSANTSKMLEITHNILDYYWKCDPLNVQITVIFYHLKVHIRKVQPVESVGLRLKKTVNLYHVYHGVSLSTGINHVINEAKSFQTTVVNYQLRWIWQRHS